MKTRRTNRVIEERNGYCERNGDQAMRKIIITLDESILARIAALPDHLQTEADERLELYNAQLVADLAQLEATHLLEQRISSIALRAMRVAESVWEAPYTCDSDSRDIFTTSARYMVSAYLFDRSWPHAKIGELLGNRAHSTIAYYCLRHRELMNVDKSYRYCFGMFQTKMNHEHPKA